MSEVPERADVVIVGAGNAAICAALAAREDGADVLVLERAPTSERGGNSAFTAGAMRVVSESVDDLRALMPDIPPERARHRRGACHATAAGLDGALVFDALSKGSADSFAFRNHGMKAILPDDYPLNAFSTEYALKDIGYALELASTTGVAAQGAELVRRVLEATRESGWGREYFPVLRRTLDATRGMVE